MPRNTTFRRNFEANTKFLQQSYRSMAIQLALFSTIDLKQKFYESELGEVYAAIPFDELTKQFVNPKIPKSNKGRKPHFTLKGGLGLMFLKHYTGMSDAKLIAQVRTNWMYQMFCDIAPTAFYEIKDKDVVGRWRAFFGHRLKLDDFQKVLAKEWKPVLEDTNVGMVDATVYESYIKYPTDVKLIFDCIEWLQKSLKQVCKGLRVSCPRSKYRDIKKRQLAYSKSKKKTRKKTRKQIKALLYLVEKLFGQLSALDYYAILDEPGKLTMALIRIIIDQQTVHFEDPKASIPNRVVSIFKPYVRPIVRGKENKPVEFGAKAHLHQVGGCNFIEHLSFEAYHEGNRLPDAVQFHNELFGKITAIAADGIYATNANRGFCRINGIATNFVQKGNEGEEKVQKSKMRKILGKARATRLEGSFGNEKNHYLLRKVKARTKETEIAWIIFGVHTANAVKVAKAIKAQKSKIVNQAA